MKIAALTARQTISEIGLVISDGPANARPFSEKSPGGELSFLIAVQRSRDRGKYRAKHYRAMPDNKWSPTGKPVAPSRTPVEQNPEQEPPAKPGARVEGSTGKGVGGPA